MSKTIVIVGSLDTKGHEFLFVKDLIEQSGVPTLVVDFGVMGEPVFAPDIPRTAVASAGGGNLADFASGRRKDAAMKVMADGLAVIVSKLYREGRLHGILGMGGSGGTSIATKAMRTLPVGIPKLMISTVGGGNVTSYAGTKDVTFMPSIVDVAGINSLSRDIYANGAGAIVGMVRQEMPRPSDEKKLIAASMFGNTTTAVEHARGILASCGYEVLVFHSTGTGGKAMEELIEDGRFAGSMDITTTELADYVCDGVFNAGPHRCMAASRAGIPAVLVPGCVDMANFGGIESVPERYRERRLYQWNPDVTLLRTNVEENIKIGELIAAAANSATAATAIFLPLRGVSMLDSEGGEFWDPEADEACFSTVRKHLKPGVPLFEMDCNINDPEFSGAVAEALRDYLPSR